jgi:Ser/Thr protein kinase RdoA (MazF antagonist)
MNDDLQDAPDEVRSDHLPHELLAFSEQVLGPCELVSDCSWGHRMSSVVSLRDGAGATWFLKQHKDHERYEAEVTAYHRWVPALGGRAPRLRASDESLDAIILSPVPGESPAWPAAASDGCDDERRASEAAVQRSAGALLRELHHGQPELPWDDFGAAMAEEFDQLAPFAAGLLTSRELAAARSEVKELTGQRCDGRVACHRDYTPRNWLVDAGTVYVVDFEWSRLDVWVSDLARLHLGIWASRPDLRDAFMSGYGRQLADADRALLHGCAVLTAVWLLVKAHETGQRSFEEGSRMALQRLMSNRY